MHFRLCVLLTLVIAANAQNTTSPEEEAAALTEEQKCLATQIEEYSMTWHVVAIFLVLSCSGIGVFSTLSLGTMTERPLFARTLQLFKMFGIGVIAATGWCHLIPDAFDSFTSECLPEAWSQYGAGFVGVFALGASFIVQSIELASGGEHSHGHGVPTHIATSPLAAQGTSVPTSPTMARDSDDAARNGPVQDSAVFRPEAETHERSKTLSTIILEAGILFHSIIIGLSLGVTGDSDTFKTLLLAICFHQFFEGLALGALISKLNHSRMYKFFGMGLMYPLTTPIGMVIGIAVRAQFNENEAGTIVIEGIFNSASAGILLYNTYSELLATEVNHNKTFKNFSRPYKVVNMLSLYMGAASMAVLAYWA